MPVFRAVILLSVLCFACSKPPEDNSAVDTTLNDTEVATSPAAPENLLTTDMTTTQDSYTASQPSTEDYSEYEGHSETPPSETSMASAALSVASLPKGSPADWISTDDYPPSALRAGEEGTSAIVWEINEQGRVENCTVSESSGSAALDQAACQAITRRGRYSPALDVSGNPTRSSSSRRVTWQIPSP